MWGSSLNGPHTDSPTTRCFAPEAARMRRQTGQRITIVGAGPGGLGAGMLLGAAGLDVTILEAGHEIGGRTARLQSGEFAWDTGPTFFLMPFVLEEIFRAAGLRLTDHVDLRRLDPMYRVLVGQEGAEPTGIDATQDLDRMAARLHELDPDDGIAFRKFIDDNRTKLRLMTPILRRSIGGALDFMRPEMMRVGPKINPFESVRKHLEKRFHHPASRLALSFQSKYLGMSPGDCPSLFSILPFIEYEYGVWHPIGGCNAVVRAMADACRGMGVRIECDQPVERIEFEGRRVTGVVTQDGVRPTDHVVLNADATWALRNLVPERLRPKWRDTAIDKKRYSCSTAMLYLGIDGGVDLPHHTIYVSSKYEKNLEDITTNGTLSDDPSIYVCNPSPIDPTLAPSGASSLYMLMPTPNTRCGMDWEGERARIRETMLDQAGERLGIENVRERIVEERAILPSDWERGRITFGATFNLAHSMGQMLHRRVPHRLPNADGVWFVGGGTHPGSGLPVIWLSSQITARLLGDEVGTKIPSIGHSESDEPLRKAPPERVPSMPENPPVPVV